MRTMKSKSGFAALEAFHEDYAKTGFHREHRAHREHQVLRKAAQANEIQSDKLLEAAACPLQRAFCRDGRRTETPINIIAGSCRTQA